MRAFVSDGRLCAAELRLSVIRSLGLRVQPLRGRSNYSYQQFSGKNIIVTVLSPLRYRLCLVYESRRCRRVLVLQ